VRRRLPAGGPAARGDFFFLPGDDGATKPPCRLPANGIGGGGGRRCRTWLGPPAAARDRRSELLGFFCRDRRREQTRLSSDARETAAEDGDLDKRDFTSGSGLGLGWAGPMRNPVANNKKILIY